MAAHLQLAARDGADLRFGQQVHSWDRDGRRRPRPHRRGRAQRGTARDLTRSVGAHGARRPRPAAARRTAGQYWFAPPGGIEPFVGSPVYMGEQAEGAQIYGFPAMDGPDGGVKVAFFRRGRDARPGRTRPRGHRRRGTARCVPRVGDTLPGLVGPVLRTEPCMYTTTPDEHFVIATPPRARQTSPWPAGSRGTGSSSCRSSGRSSPTSPPPGPRPTRSPSSTRGGSHDRLHDPRSAARLAAVARPHASRLCLHRPVGLRRRAGADLRTPLDVRRARGRPRHARRVPHRRRWAGRASCSSGVATVRCARSSTSAGTAAPGCARRSPGSCAATCSARITRGPTTSTASSSRRRT